MTELGVCNGIAFSIQSPSAGPCAAVCRSVGSVTLLPPYSQRHPMTRTLKVIAGLALFAVATGVGFAVARDILHPQFTPEKGTWDKPEGKMGQKPDNPWSV